jgi:hypothetical protein
MRSFCLAVTVLVLSACNCGGMPPGSGGGGGGTQGSGGGATAGGGSSSGGGTSSSGGGTSSSGGGTASTGGGSAGGGSSGGGSGGCGACDTPPDACHGAGSCVNGQCQYPFVEGATCDDGNACTVGDTCHNNACQGTPKVCDTPPNAVCASATNLISYDATGACQAGLCVYAQHNTACGTGGCRNDACTNDVCGSITCNAPPSACYAAMGSCSNGSCTYAFADGVTCDDGDACTTQDSCASGLCQGVPKQCLTPPANTCADAMTLRSYTSVGACNAGSCSYTSSLIPCAMGCANGLCTGSGWTTQTSGTQDDLSAVWGSSPSAVWAGGAYGTLLFFNGTSWSSRVSGITNTVVSLAGSGASSLFLVAGDLDVLTLRYWDGAAWSTVPVTLTGQIWDYGTTSCVGAFGPGDGVLVTMEARPDQPGSINSPLHPVRSAYRVTKSATAWTVTPLGDYQIATGYDYNGCGVSVLSSTTFVVAGGPVIEWNGTAFVPFGGMGGTGYSVYAASATSAISVNTGQLVDTLNAGSWGTANVGFGANGVGGTSATRVFVVGGHGAGPYTPDIAQWDGQGFTPLALPAGTANAGYLNSVWASPTGAVFAVGSSGLILKGP